jgi:hypothetical protein
MSNLSRSPGPRRGGRSGEGVVFLTVGATVAFLSPYDDPKKTPVPLSPTDEAELLLGAFGYHYLKRGSWRSRAEFIDYVGQACPEYNRLYAHPFEWTWSSQEMRQWVKKHGL